MTEAEKIIALILEADEDDTIKDILGPEYHEPAAPTLSGSVYRHDRWADVEIGTRHYCISYLTPVAYFDPDGEHVVRTSRHWSNATLNHIKKWLDHIGFDTAKARWAEIEQRFPKTISQDALIAKFKEDALRVKWNKRQARTMGAVPYQKIRTGLKSASDERVDIDPYHEPRKEWEE